LKCRNSRRDGGRPSGAVLQGEASNNPGLLRLRAVVVSVREKASREASCKLSRDERKRTTAEASKAATCDIGTRSLLRGLGRVQREPVDWLDGVRCVGGVTRLQALLGDVGTCRLEVKGEVQVINVTRASVPKPGTGAEQPVLARKRGNARGAKGLRHSVLDVGQPARGGAHG
jgi:hypothetical protein